VKKIVTKMMDKKIEDKRIMWNIQYDVRHNSTITNGDLVPIVQSIGTGTLDYQRVGDRITPKYLTVFGRVWLSDQSMATNRPLEVRVVAFNAKQYKSNSSVTSIDTSTLLRGELGTLVSYNGTIMHSALPMNDAQFSRVFDKRIRLNMQASAGSSYPSSIASSSAFFSFKVKCPKYFKYDTTTNTPTNFAPFFAIGYTYLDGTPADVLSPEVYCSATSSLTYEDA